MSQRARLLAAASVVTGVLAFVIIGLLIDAGVYTPAWLTGRGAGAGAESAAQLSERPLPSRSQMGFATQQILPPDATFEQHLQQQYAEYDRLVVEVHSDGSLCVLGEDMPLDTLRSLIGSQQQEGMPTLVAIRPDSDCVYRHIDHLIQLCHDLGVPHLMVAAAPASVNRAESTSPPAPL